MELIVPNQGLNQLSQDYQRIEHAILFLEEYQSEQPKLKEIAESVGLSEYHFQRLFTRWVGISPKRFMQYLTKEHAKQLLEDSADLLSTTYGIGLSSPGRLHDLFISCEAVTPGEFKNRGEGVEIRYGFHPSPFGEILVALSQRGISNLMFVHTGDRAVALKALKAYWPAAEVNEERVATGEVAAELLCLFQGQTPNPLRLYIRGTNFQIKVWEALLHIPTGSVVSYEDISVYIGMPGSSRAVGNALARNPIPVLIPCHRVIRKSGDFGEYRYGTPKKKALLGWEMARQELASSKDLVMLDV